MYSAIGKTYIDEGIEISRIYCPSFGIANYAMYTSVHSDYATSFCCRGHVSLIIVKISTLTSYVALIFDVYANAVFSR